MRKNCKPYFPWITWCTSSIICWNLGLFGGGGGGQRQRDGVREKRREREREAECLEIRCIPWVAKQKSPRKGKKKKSCRKLTQSRIMAKSIKFDQVCYNEVELHIPSRDNEDRSQVLEMCCSLCAWNMQQPAGSHKIITQYLCGSRKLPAQVECPRYIKRQHSEMFLMNIFVRERKGIWMIFVYAGNKRWNITVKIQVPLFIFTPLFTASRV